MEAGRKEAESGLVGGGFQFCSFTPLFLCTPRRTPEVSGTSSAGTPPLPPISTCSPGWPPSPKFRRGFYIRFPPASSPSDDVELLGFSVWKETFDPSTAYQTAAA